MNNYKRETILNFFSYIVPKLVSIALYAFTVSYYINHLGAKNYGLLMIILMIYNYLYLFDFGIGYAINYRFSRKVALNTHSATNVLSYGIPFYIFSSLFFGAIIFIFSKDISLFIFHTAIYSSEFHILSFSCFFLMFSYFFTGIISAYNSMYLTNISNFILDLFKNGALLIGSYFKLGLIGIMVTIMIGTIFKLILDLYFSCRKIRSAKWLVPKISLREIKLNFKMGIPMLVVLMSSLFFNSIGKLVSAKYFGLDDVAYISIASDVSSKAYFLLAAVNGSLSTILIRKTALNDSKIGIIKISFFSVILISIFYYLPIMFFSKKILSLWISTSISERTSLLLSVFSISSILYMVYDVFYNIYQSSGKFFINTIVSIFGVVTLSLGIMFSIDEKKIIDIGYSYCFMYIVMILFFIIFIYKNNKILYGK